MHLHMNNSCISSGHVLPPAQSLHAYKLPPVVHLMAHCIMHCVLDSVVPTCTCLTHRSIFDSHAQVLQLHTAVKLYQRAGSNPLFVKLQSTVQSATSDPQAANQHGYTFTQHTPSGCMPCGVYNTNGTARHDCAAQRPTACKNRHWQANKVLRNPGTPKFSCLGM
jgi:hypothetical protein